MEILRNRLAPHAAWRSLIVPRPSGTAMPRLAVNPVRVLEDQEERLRSRFRQQQPPQSVGRALAPLPRAPCMHHGQVPVVAPESARAVSVETPLGEAAPPSRA